MIFTRNNRQIYQNGVAQLVEQRGMIIRRSAVRVRPSFLTQLTTYMEKTIKVATLGIAGELRNMEIGDVVQFPVPKYNYNSIRTSPGTTLVAETMEGRKWKTRKDIDNKCVFVTRTA